MKLLILSILFLALVLTGCGASVQTCNTVSTNATAYINETLPFYVQNNPSDADNAKNNASALINSCIAAESEAASLPTPAQIAADAQTITQILEELAQLIPIIQPLISAQKNGTVLTSTQQAQVDEFYSLQLRVKVLRSHYKK